MKRKGKAALVPTDIEREHGFIRKPKPRWSRRIGDEPPYHTSRVYHMVASDTGCQPLVGGGVICLAGYTACGKLMNSQHSPYGPPMAVESVEDPPHELRCKRCVKAAHKEKGNDAK